MCILAIVAMNRPTEDAPAISEDVVFAGAEDVAFACSVDVVAVIVIGAFSFFFLFPVFFPLIPPNSFPNSATLLSKSAFPSNSSSARLSVSLIFFS